MRGPDGEDVGGDPLRGLTLDVEPERQTFRSAAAFRRWAEAHNAEPERMLQQLEAWARELLSAEGLDADQASASPPHSPPWCAAEVLVEVGRARACLGQVGDHAAVGEATRACAAAGHAGLALARAAEWRSLARWKQLAERDALATRRQRERGREGFRKGRGKQVQQRSAEHAAWLTTWDRLDPALSERARARIIARRSGANPETVRRAVRRLRPRENRGR